MLRAAAFYCALPIALFAAACGGSGEDPPLAEAGVPPPFGDADAQVDVAAPPPIVAADAGSPRDDAGSPPDAGSPSAGDAGVDSGCGVVCSTAHITPICTGSTCSGQCDPGFADCNENKQADGCEVSTGTDHANCGGCGVVCSSNNASPACVNGTCTSACAPGFADCDGNAQTNGCEVSTSTDPANCGACGDACPAPAHATPTCAASVCGGACVAGFADCNAQMSDGCETDRTANPADCGGCGVVCSTNHVAAACANGTCSGACAVGFADCDGDKQVDGCEMAVSADPLNCGGCGVVCSGKIGRACTAGMCNATCDDGLKNQGEADVDCGGPCPPCGIGRACATGADCRSDLCSGGRCAALTCAHGFGLPGPPLGVTGQAPQSMAVADVDSDGKLDVVVGNAIDDTIGVSRGHGDGTFDAPVTYPAAGRPQALATGDVNRDGHPDLFAANFYDGTVSVFLNTGSGAFAAKVDYPASEGAAAVATGDMNGDGKLDLVVAGSSIALLNGLGGGTFAPAVTFQTPYGAQAGGVAVGDLDGDGLLDVVEVDTDAVSVFINQGSGTLGAGTSYGYGTSAPMAVIVADVDGNGSRDVVLAAQGGAVSQAGAVSVFLNKGNGALESATVYAGGGAGAIVADLNGDGKLDVAATDSQNWSVGVLLNAGAGALAPPANYLVGYTPRAIAWGDFDGNGTPDLVATNEDNETTSVLLNRGNGLFEARTTYPTGDSTGAVAVGDLNRDGLPDVVAANSTTFNDSSNTMIVLLGAGGAALRTGVSYATASEPVAVALADLNADGWLDVAVAQQGAGTVGVFLNRGNGALGARTDVPVGPSGVASTSSLPSSIVAADFNSDGKIDLAVDSPAGIDILFNEGDATFDLPASSVATGAISTEAGDHNLAHSIAAADMNFDGRPDLVRLQMIGEWGGDVPVLVILYNNGNGTFALDQNPTTLTTFSTTLLLGDVLGVSGSEGFAVGEQNATVSINGQALATNFNPQDMALGDFNGDGIPDLAVASAKPVVSIFVATSPGVFGPRLDYATSGALAIVATDLDGDGRAEVVVGGDTALNVLPNLCLP